MSLNFINWTFNLCLQECTKIENVNVLFLFAFSFLFAVWLILFPHSTTCVLFCRNTIAAAIMICYCDALLLAINVSQTYGNWMTITTLSLSCSVCRYKTHLTVMIPYTKRELSNGCVMKNITRLTLNASHKSFLHPLFMSHISMFSQVWNLFLHFHSTISRLKMTFVLRLVSIIIKDMRMCTQMLSARGRARGQVFAGNDKNIAQSPKVLLKDLRKALPRAALSFCVLWTH